MITLKRFFLLRKRNVFSNLLKFTGLTTSLFIFQACYGTGPEAWRENSLSGYVNEEGAEKGVCGLEVSMILNGEEVMLAQTDEMGYFFFDDYPESGTEYIIRVNDPDGDINGHYLPLDTTIDQEGMYSELELNVDKLDN